MTLCTLLAYDDNIMKKTIYKISFLTLVIFLLLPSITFAAWWNPLSWFGGKSTHANEQVAIKETSNQNPVVLQQSVVSKKQIAKTTAPIIVQTIAQPNTDEHVRGVVMEVVQQYLPQEELERIRSVTDHTTANFDPDKTGLQLAYIPGSMIADDGTYFSATHLGSGDLNTGEATLGDTTINGGLSVQGSVNSQGFTTSNLQVGSGGNSVGITLYDADTNEPMCLKVKSGSIAIYSGTCN